MSGLPRLNGQGLRQPIALERKRWGERFSDEATDGDPTQEKTRPTFVASLAEQAMATLAGALVVSLRRFRPLAGTLPESRPMAGKGIGYFG
jgi:hypothetical protein